MGIFGISRDILLLFIGWKMIEMIKTGSYSGNLLFLFSLTLIFFALYSLLKNFGIAPRI